MTTATATPISYEDYLKLVKPGMIDPATGRFYGPDHGVNYQAEGMTPQEFYDYMNQMVQDPMARDGSDAGLRRRGSMYRGDVNPTWVPGAVGHSGMQAGGKFLMGVLGGLYGAYSGIGSAAGSAGSTVGPGDAGWGTDLGTDAVSSGIGPGDPGWGTDLGTDAVSTGTAGPGDPGWGSDIGTDAVGPSTPGPGDPGWGSDLGTDAASTGATGSKSLIDQAKNLISKRYMDASGAINWANVLKDGATGLAAVTAYQQAANANGNNGGNGGYQGGIPTYSALRAAVPTPTGARPGAGGLRYLTDVVYNANGAQGAQAQQDAVNAQLSGLAAQNQANVASQQAASGGPYVMGANNGGNPSSGTPRTGGTIAPVPVGGGAPTTSPAPGGSTMPSTAPTAGTGDGMWVQGKYITKAELQNAFKNGVNPVEYLQKAGITDLGQIHDLVTQAEGIAGNAPTGDAALQKYFKEYQQYNPNGKYANDFAAWRNDQNPNQLNAMMAGTYSGAAMSPSDFAPGGIYGPGSAYYGQAGYGSGQGPRGMGNLGGGWDTPGAATGGNGQLTAAQQQQVMDAAARGQPMPTFGAPAPVNSTQIQQFYEQHKNDPAAIQAAMAQYHVTPEQAAAATGQSASVFAPAPQAAPAHTEPAGPGISNADINAFWQQHQGDQGAIKAAMAQYGVTPEQAAAATGQSVNTFQFAGGGLAGLPSSGRYLRGPTDGMADMIPARIDGQQEAALGHGEFVVPADVVSHLGNGNSDAGAEELHRMMDKIRMARTGTKQQGREIDPSKFTPGGLASLRYATGGKVRHFDAGGAIPTGSGITGTSSNLSDWIGPYVTDMLGKGKALTEMPYQAYGGPLTAGPTALQTQAFGEAANLTTPSVIGQAANSALQAGQAAGGASYAPTTFTAGDFTHPGTASQFMSPYMDQVVQNQQRDAQRQADIASTYRQSDQTKAGAFGGSRAAIMDAEAARNLALQKGDIAATGLQSAFTAGQNQFNTQQQSNLANNQATEASRQFGANLGLQGLNTQLNAANTAGNLGATQANTGIANLNAQLGAGGVQQGIEQAGVTADQAQFDKEQNNPFKMLTYQQSLLQGLPLSTQNYNVATNPLASAANTASGIASLWNAFTS